MPGSGGCPVPSSSPDPVTRLRAHWSSLSPPHSIRVLLVCVKQRFAPALVFCCRTDRDAVEKKVWSCCSLPEPGIGAVLLPEIQLGSTHCLQRRLQ